MRRVDLDGVCAGTALTCYLPGRRTKSARKLAKKAVMIVDPPALRGTAVWSPRDRG